MQCKQFQHGHCHNNAHYSVHALQQSVCGAPCCGGQLSDVFTGVWTVKQWILKIKRKSERFYLHNRIEMCHDGTHRICSSRVSFIKNPRRLQSCDADVQTDVHVRGMRGNISEGTLPAVLAAAREEVPQSFIVWTWKEIIRHTQIYNPAKSCMAHLSHVAERRKKRRGGGWILWSAVCHRPLLLFALPSKKRVGLRSWSSFLLCYCSGVLGSRNRKRLYQYLFGN